MVLGPGFVSTSPAFRRSSASYPEGLHGLLVKKNGKLGRHCWGGRFRHNLQLRLNYDIQTHICKHKRKSGETSLRTWTRKQISPSCGELLKELMAVQNVRHRTKQLPSMETRSLRPSSSPLSSTKSSTHQVRPDY